MEASVWELMHFFHQEGETNIHSFTSQIVKWNEKRQIAQQAYTATCGND